MLFSTLVLENGSFPGQVTLRSFIELCGRSSSRKENQTVPGFLTLRSHEIIKMLLALDVKHSAATTS